MEEMRGCASDGNIAARIAFTLAKPTHDREYPPPVFMTPAQQLLLAATLTFVGAVVQALLALKSGAWKERRARVVFMALGFALQTGFIYVRGEEVGRHL